MEKAILGITLRDKKRSMRIREKTKLKDIILIAKQQKWRWAGHVAKINDKNIFRGVFKNKYKNTPRRLK